MTQSWTLVTGANGFLGARLVRRLVEQGKHVKAMVRAGADLSPLKDLPHDRVRIAMGDCRYQDRVFAALRACDELYHVAAAYSLNERSREQILADSVEGTIATLEAARRADVKKIVFTSSAVTLGSTDHPEIMDESHTARAGEKPAYIEAKIRAEEIALERAVRGEPIVVVNPAGVFGPGDHKPTPTGAQVVHYLNTSPSFKIPIIPGGFGVVDVDDVAAGHIAAMEKGKVGERYILASENFDTRAFYQMLADITGLAEPGADIAFGQANLMATFEELRSWWSGKEPLLSRKALMAYFCEYRFVSSDKAKRELGFSPRPAREALTRACHFFLDGQHVERRAAQRARLELRTA
jgi:dihydroflavonol-4-reductase